MNSFQYLLIPISCLSFTAYQTFYLIFWQLYYLPSYTSSFPYPFFFLTSSSPTFMSSLCTSLLQIATVSVHDGIGHVTSRRQQEKQVCNMPQLSPHKFPPGTLDWRSKYDTKFFQFLRKTRAIHHSYFYLANTISMDYQIARTLC